MGPRHPSAATCEQAGRPHQRGYATVSPANTTKSECLSRDFIRAWKRRAFHPRQHSPVSPSWA